MASETPIEDVAADPATKQKIAKINAMTGLTSQVIRDVWEATFIDTMMQLMENPEKLQSVTIPFYGTLGVRYESDSIDRVTGKLNTEVTVFFAPSDTFKDIFGDIHDGKRTPIPDFITSHLLSRTTGIIQNS